MQKLYDPHKDPIVLILVLALFITGGVAYALKLQLDNCWEANQSARGQVYTIPLASGVEQKVTSHDGKVYILIQAPSQ